VAGRDFSSTRNGRFEVKTKLLAALAAVVLMVGAARAATETCIASGTVHTPAGGAATGVHVHVAFGWTNTSGNIESAVFDTWTDSNGGYVVFCDINDLQSPNVQVVSSLIGPWEFGEGYSYASGVCNAGDSWACTINLVAIPGNNGG
jgi:hypothetical protein